MTNKTSLFFRGGLFVLFALSALCARPQSIIQREYLSSAAALPATSVIHIQDDRLAQLNSGTGIDFRDKTAYGLLRIGFDPDMNQCHTDFTSFRVTVRSAGGTIAVPGSPVPSTDLYTLTVSYDPLLDRVDVENAFVKVDFLRRTETDILQITAIDRAGNETAVTNPADLPPDLYFEVELVRERYADFNPAHIGSVPVFTTVSSTETGTYYNEHNVHVFEWANVDGAVEYELEWIYVDDYSATGLGVVRHPSALQTVFKDNASSVRLPRAAVNRFFVPAIYERGWVVCRVRAVGKGGPELEDDIFGNWSADDGNILAFVPAAAKRYSYMVNGSSVPDFEFNNVNAKYGIQFAEEGKILASGLFADGSFRTRQNVTAIKVEEDLAYGKKSLISETIYDHMGRAAVSVLPAVTKNGLWYTPNYNLNKSEEKYSYRNFDLSTLNEEGCITTAGPMSMSSGASMYYSGNNPDKSKGQQGLVPDAFNFPFVHTAFARDNTNRPKIQGAPGELFQMGYGHEIRYVYGSAEQVQLNRLFGTDAGYENYYQKTMMIDPNGQIGITYTDMFGRTVATSLAGKVPTALDPLTDDRGIPLSEAGDEIDEDMLGKSGAIPHGTSNPLSSDGKSFTFSKTLLIDAEQTYHFSYSTQILEFTGACFPGLCLDCIYDLELSLTDECGNYLIGNQEHDGPFRKTLGGTDWDTTCTVPPESGFADDFTLLLAPGAYNIYKKLSINEDAMAFYVEKMMANSTCLAGPDHFYEMPDTSGCSITCEDCLAHIGTWEDFFTQAKIEEQFAGDAVLAHATLWPVYQAMKSECDGLCTDLTRDYCRASYELLLSDVSRGGQYGEADSDPDGHFDPGAYPLSIFNPANRLPQKRTDQFNTLLFGSASMLLDTYVNNRVPSWKRPVYLDMSDPAAAALLAGYYDEGGNRITVHVQKDENNAYSPQVTDPAQVYVVDAAANRYYTYPENLARLDDFLNGWNPAYANSLVIYHPEFFQYEWCITHYRYTSTVGGEAVNTFNYDQKLSDMIMTPGSAPAFLGSGYTGMTVSGLIQHLTDNDPFFKASGNPLSANFFPSFPQTLAQVLQNKLTNYQSVDYMGLAVPVNFAQSVYLMHHCGYNLGCLPTAVSAPVFGTGGLIRTDADWRALIDFYVSEKQSLMAFHQQMYAVFGETPNTTASWTLSETACIGNNGFFPFGSFVLNNTATWPANPCGPFSWSAYPDKQRRFGSAMDAVANSFGLSNPPTAAELQQYASQGYYGETGKCPMVSDLEFMLAKLAQDNLLTTPADLMNGMLGSSLYNYITQNGTTDPPSILYGPTVTGNTLSVTVPQSPCNPFLTLTLPTGKSFGNITFFYGTGDIAQVSSDYTFTIRALYLDPSAGITVPETLEVSGTTCIPLTGCEAGFQSVCKPTAQAKDLTRLMSMLSMNGQLNSASPVVLNTPMYTPLLTPALQVYLGPGGTYTWKKTSSTQFDLTNTANSHSLRLTVTANTLGASQTYRFTKIEGPQVTTPTPASYTQFTFTATEADPAYPLTTPGAILQTMSGHITVIGASQTFPVTECHPIRPVSCNTQEHKNRDGLETIFKQWMEMGQYGFTPEVITDGCLTDIVTTGPALTPPLILVSLEADMSRAEAFGTSNYFIATIKSGSGGGTLTVSARYCLPLRNCDTCGVTSCNDLGFAVSFPGSFTPQYETRYELNWPCAGFALSVPYTHASPQDYWADVASQVQGAAIPGVTAYASGGVLYVQVTDAQLLALCPCDDSGNRAGIYLKTDPIALFSPTCCNTGTAPGQGGRASTSEFEPWPPLPQNRDCHPTLLPIPDEPTPYYNPCVEYLLQTAAVNAQFRYEEYLKEKREEYRQMYLQRCMQAMETFNRTYRDGQYHYTLYYYDRAGNLVKTVPPHAVTPLTGSDLAAVDAARNAGTVRVPEHNRTPEAPFRLTTRYRYNSLNGLAEQITPDGGKSRFYYDRLGRIAASQNAKQYAESTGRHVYAYMLYDAQGRVTESGKMANLSAATRTSVYEAASWNAFFTPGSYTASEVTQTLYDVTTPTALGTFVQENLRSRISSVITQPKGETGFVFGTYYSYDIHGNVKSLVHRNLLVPFPSLQQNRLDYDYDLISGNVKKVSYNAGRPDRYFHRYTYDDQNRLKEAATSRNDIQYDLDARYFYYWHGPLSRTELGQNKIQGMDYAYNLQGWAKSLNSDALSKDTDPGYDGYVHAGSANTYFGRDAYGYSLHYFDGDYTPIEAAYRPDAPIPAGFGAADLWNGNIRAMNHTLKEPDGYAVKPLLQRYTYDQLQRIKAGEAYDALDRTNNTWDDGASVLGTYATSYSYDPAGNLLALGRAGNNAGTPEMDDFKYKYYPGSNRLQRVNDNIPSGNYDMDVDDQGSGDNYIYDELGNLVYDRAEEIEEITWTLAGKVSEIKRPAGSGKPDLHFYYDAMGNRVMKAVIPKDAGKTIEYYVHDAQGNPLTIYTYAVENGHDVYRIEEQTVYGQARIGSWKSGSDLLAYIPEAPPVYKTERGKKRYEMNNHQVNVQTVVSDRKKQICRHGIFGYYEADIRNTYDYYPFGMNMPGRDMEKSVSPCVDDTVYTVNETFDSGVGGFLPGQTQVTLSNSAQRLRVNVSAVFNFGSTFYTYRPFSVTAGKAYEFSFTYEMPCQNIRLGSRGNPNDTVYATITVTVKDAAGNTIVTENITDSPNGNRTLHFTAPTTGTYTVEFREDYMGTCAYYLDNVVLKYIDPCAQDINGTGYRYGYQGQEKDDEVKGKSNSLNYKYRMHDPRIGRFFAMDPLTSKYPYYTPYSFSGNIVIHAIELEGLEELVLSSPPNLSARPRTKPTLYRYSETTLPNTIMFVFPTGTPGISTTITRPLTLAEQRTLKSPKPSNSSSTYSSNVEDKDNNYIRQTFSRNGGADGGEIANPPPLNANTTTTRISGDFNKIPTSTQTFNIPVAGGATQLAIQYSDGGSFPNSFVLTDAATGTVLSPRAGYSTSGSTILSIPGGVSNINLTVTGSPDNLWDSFSFSASSSGPDSAAVNVSAVSSVSQTTSPISVQNNVTSSKNKPINR